MEACLGAFVCGPNGPVRIQAPGLCSTPHDYAGFVSSRLQREDCPITLHVSAGPGGTLGAYEALNRVKSVGAIASFAKYISSYGQIHHVSVEADASQGLELTADAVPGPWQVDAVSMTSGGNRTTLRSLVFLPVGAEEEAARGRGARESDIAVIRYGLNLDPLFFERHVERWLMQLLPPVGSELPPQYQLAACVEAFHTAWTAFANAAELAGEDRRTGDALARMATEVTKDTNPPKGVLREAFDWFANKADVFAEEFARGAGKTTGAAFGVGLGATASGQLPNLVRAIDAVRTLLT
jgi:hypothetical protein